MKNRVEYDAEGYLDEIVTDGGAHLERMGGAKGGKEWFLCCYRKDGSSVALWITGSVTLREERPAQIRFAAHGGPVSPDPPPTQESEMSENVRQMDATYPAVMAFLERHILATMDESTPSHWSGGYAFGFASFTNEWIDREMVRAVCRRLRRRGLVRYYKGLMSEDGEMGGAGYGITEAGRAYLATLWADTRAGE